MPLVEGHAGHTRAALHVAWSSPRRQSTLPAVTSRCCYLGGFNDGSYGYLAQRQGGTVQARRLHQVQVLDLATTDPDLKVFGGGFSDGSYGYLAPNLNGEVARFRLDVFNQVQVLDPPMPI